MKTLQIELTEAECEAVKDIARRQYWYANDSYKGLLCGIVSKLEAARAEERPAHVEEPL